MKMLEKLKDNVLDWLDNNKGIIINLSILTLVVSGTIFLTWRFTIGMMFGSLFLGALLFGNRKVLYMITDFYKSLEGLENVRKKK